MHFKPEEKTIRKNKFGNLTVFSSVLVTTNIFYKSEVKNHIHKILGTKSGIFANSLLGLET